jgi:hypothetical protein
LAARPDAIERPIDDLLNAQAHVLHAPGRGRLHHEAARVSMVRQIQLQH